LKIRSQAPVKSTSVVVVREEEKQVTHTSTRQEQHHTTHDKNNTTNDHTKNHPLHLTTIEGGAATVRTTSHTRVGGRAEASLGSKVMVCGNMQRRVVFLHVEYAERRRKYGILFTFSQLCEWRAISRSVHRRQLNRQV